LHAIPDGALSKVARKALPLPSVLSHIPSDRSQRNACGTRCPAPQNKTVAKPPVAGLRHRLLALLRLSRDTPSDSNTASLQSQTPTRVSASAHVGALSEPPKALEFGMHPRSTTAHYDIEGRAADQNAPTIGAGLHLETILAFTAERSTWNEPQHGVAEASSDSQ